MPKLFDKRADIGKYMSNLNILLMLLVYIAIAMSIIISHIFIGYSIKNYENNLTRKKKFWLNVFSECKNSGTYLLKKGLIKKLKDATMLEAFSDAYNEAREDNSDIKRILYDNRAQIAELGSKLRSNTMRAFFAYMLTGFDLRKPIDNQHFDDIMLRYLSYGSVYVRENALLALLSFGNEKKSLKLLSVCPKTTFIIAKSFWGMICSNLPETKQNWQRNSWMFSASSTIVLKLL